MSYMFGREEKRTKKKGTMQLQVILRSEKSAFEWYRSTNWAVKSVHVNQLLVLKVFSKQFPVQQKKKRGHNSLTVS